MTELRHLSPYCNFEAYLDQALRDCHVCRLHCESIQKHLLIETDLTLMCALELAQGMETADQNAKSFEESEAVVVKGV